MTKCHQIQYYGVFTPFGERNDFISAEELIFPLKKKWHHNLQSNSLMLHFSSQQLSFCPTQTLTKNGLSDHTSFPSSKASLPFAHRWVLSFTTMAQPRTSSMPMVTSMSPVRPLQSPSPFGSMKCILTWRLSYLFHQIPCTQFNVTTLLLIPPAQQNPLTSKVGPIQNPTSLTLSTTLLRYFPTTTLCSKIPIFPPYLTLRLFPKWRQWTDFRVPFTTT